jgi:hypothetical protein
MTDFLPWAPRFGKDQHFFQEAKERTPAQLALGDERYQQLVTAWWMRPWYENRILSHTPYTTLPDSYVESEDRHA